MRPFWLGRHYFTPSRRCLSIKVGAVGPPLQKSSDSVYKFGESYYTESGKNRYFNAEENEKYMLITKEMGIMETVQKYPATVEVLQRFGMGCIGCAAAHFENIEQGALAHGIDVPALMEALNRAAEA